MVAQQPFVSDLARLDAAGFDDGSTVNSGFGREGTISADRRYVTMNSSELAITSLISKISR